MTIYYRKPPVVEAKFFDGTKESAIEVIGWLRSISLAGYAYHARFVENGIIGLVPNSDKHDDPTIHAESWAVVDDGRLLCLNDSKFKAWYDVFPE